MDLDVEREALQVFRSLIDTLTEGGLVADRLKGLEVSVAARVRAMLVQHQSPPGAMPRVWLPLSSSAPTQLGPFRIREELGRGGMGVVYLGERVEAGFKQLAALKWLPPLDSDALRRARFQIEREVVARLEHPNIARLIDGGEALDGHLWYAMEYVTGIPIHEHCSKAAGSIADHVRLIIELCGAVEYAHQNLVLHRDIKPGNVLVNDQGQVKLIDFGIAKQLSEQSGLTLESSPLTPRYAAPETLAGETPTTASDQWQLAALAFEVLTGTAVRAAPAQALASEVALASVHHTGSALHLKGDLDAVLRKALSADPRDRYADVRSFASELSSWLQHRPVLARREERWYGTVRFVQRNRWAVGFATLTLVASLIFGAVSWHLALNAEREARTTKLTSELAMRMLLIGNDAPDMRSMTLRNYIVYQVRVLLDAEGLPAEVRLPLLQGLGNRAVEVRATDIAVEAARAFLELTRQSRPALHIDTALAIDRLVSILILANGAEAAAEAGVLLDESLRVYEASGWPKTSYRFSHAQARAHQLQSSGRPAEAAEVFLELDPFIASDKELDSVDRTSAIALAGSFLAQDGQFGRSVETFERALEVSRVGNAPAEAARAQRQTVEAQLCSSLSALDAERGLEFCSGLIEQQAQEGIQHSYAGGLAISGLARSLAGLGRHHDAIRQYENGLAGVRQRVGDGPPTPLEVHLRRGLGLSLLELGRAAEAVEPLRYALENSKPLEARSARSSIEARAALAEALLATGEEGQARDLVDASLIPGFEDQALLDRWQRLLRHFGHATASPPDPDPN